MQKNQRMTTKKIKTNPICSESPHKHHRHQRRIKYIEILADLLQPVEVPGDTEILMIFAGTIGQAFGESHRRDRLFHFQLHCLLFMRIFFALTHSGTLQRGGGDEVYLLQVPYVYIRSSLVLV